MQEHIEKMRREIEKLGEDRNYQGQAQAFIAGTGCKIEARYLETKGGHFDRLDKELRDMWELRITRNSREYVTKFGASIRDTNDYSRA